MTFFKELVVEPKPKPIIINSPLHYYFQNTSDDSMMFVTCPCCGEKYLYSAVDTNTIKEVSDAIRNNKEYFEEQFEQSCPNIEVHGYVKIIENNEKTSTYTPKEKREELEENLYFYRFWFVGNDGEKDIWVKCPICGHAYLFFKPHNEEVAKADLRRFRKHYYQKIIRDCPMSKNHSRELT